MRYASEASTAPLTRQQCAECYHWYSRESMEALAKDCEFVNLRGVHPPLKDADKITFVEEIQRSESDYKQLSQKYAKSLRNETVMGSNQS